MPPTVISERPSHDRRALWFRDSPTSRRRHACLPASNDMSISDLLHSGLEHHIRGPEDIHQTKAEPKTWLGYVSCDCLLAHTLTRFADDWLIILPTILSIALIGPSHKR